MWLMRDGPDFNPAAINLIASKRAGQRGFRVSCVTEVVDIKSIRRVIHTRKRQVRHDRPAQKLRRYLRRFGLHSPLRFEADMQVDTVITQFEFEPCIE